MKSLSLILLVLVGISSLICFLMCAFDKRAAKAGHRRIPERRFFLLALLGGGPGLWMGMRCFHHKTLHRSFWFAAIGSTTLYAALLLAVALRIAQII